MAVREELIDRNPYSSYKFKFTKSEREYLTEDELLAIQELDLSNNKSLDKIRDIFLFTCNTGVRFQDAQDLTLSRLKTTDNGKMYLNFKMTKTSEMVAIPLSKQAKSIITKYADNPLRITEGSLLPRISNVKFNEYIKIITSAVGIEKKVSHHVARHTFATLALNRGVSIVAVQKLLGHTTVRTTEIYAKMLQSTVFDEMDKFDMD
jgi:site-specific recombinase XerD